MPAIKYQEMNFRKNSLDLINFVNTIIYEYGQQGFSLTLRQLYYQLVARDIIPNTERSYKNIGNLINNGRLAGLIDWFAIEDRTRFIRRNSHWDDVQDIILSCANSFTIDKWERQQNYLEVWVEKDALISIVGSVCSRLDVSYFSCRGYVSQSEMWQAAQRLKRYRDKSIIILHLGDHDPSGIDMSRDITERLNMFGVFPVFKRIALNMNQIEEYNPPPNPAKFTDSRCEGYVQKYGYSSWELDALEPSVTADLIETHINQFIDIEEFKRCIEFENKEKEFINAICKSIDNIRETLGY